jgi:hypothetical protein
MPQVIAPGVRIFTAEPNPLAPYDHPLVTIERFMAQDDNEEIEKTVILVPSP